MLKYLKKYIPTAILASVFMILEVSVDLIQPRMMQKIVDEGILGTVPDPAMVTSIGIRMILIVFCGGLCGILCGVFTNITAQNYGNDIRKDCFRRIMHFSFEQMDYFSTGSLITRITSDTTQVQNMLSQTLRGMTRSLMFLIGGTFALLSLNLSFGKILACTIPLIFAEILFVVLKSSPMFALLQKRLDVMNGVIQEDIAGSRVIKAYVQEDNENKRFEKTNEDLTETQFKVLILISWMRPVMNIVLNCAIVAIVYVGALQVQAGEIGPGRIMAAITYISQILNGMMMLAMIFQTFSRGIASSARLKEVLATYPAIADGSYEHGVPEESGTVCFKDVSFTYPGQKNAVLSHVNLQIHSGETLAIIGATGSGKSTLIQLIPRFYDAVDGSVEVDGVNVRDYPLKDLRSKVAVVLQKSELFTSSIRDNIAIGNPEASEEEIRTAAKTAQAEEFILRQPEGYETMVAENGMSLSGGQKQRICIARALVRKAEILILDDSTSALDLSTEAELHHALDQSYGKMTRIIIAQRIASVKRADRIAVIDDGTIVACAPHKELMKTCTVYQNIYDSQLKREGEDA